MNYFERLVRRALLQPAKQPGAPLADPFENVAEWTLDPPARTPPASPVAAESRNDRHNHETSATNHVPEKRERPSTASKERTVPPPPVERQASAQPAPIVTHEVVRETASPAITPPLASNDANAPDEVAPLEIADRFMRGLGVKVPSSTPPPFGTPPAPFLQPHASRSPPQEEFRAAPSQVVAPPVQATRPPPASRPIPVGETSAPPSRAAEHRTEEPARRAGPPIETREVIVIERQASRVREDSIPGGGSPRFGLGQL